METKRSEKVNFTKNKKICGNIDEINDDKILVSKKESYGTKVSFKYLIEYTDNDDIKPLCIKLPQMIGYVKHSENNNKTMYFNVNDKKLLEKVY